MTPNTEISSAKIVSGRDPASGNGLHLKVEDGCIVDIDYASYSGSHWLSAGLIDLQVNGYAGIDLNDGAVDPERLLALAKKLSSLGVTTFLPTLITASFDQVFDSLNVIGKARLKHALLARMIPCVHLEGLAYHPRMAREGRIRPNMSVHQI